MNYLMGALYRFFANLLGLGTFDNLSYYDDIQFTIGGLETPLGDYLAFLLSLGSLIFIFVLCCLFIYKIIKLVGGLIR